MKLSQMTNDKASETLIRLSTPIANILEDKNIQPVFKEIADGKDTPIVELVGKTIPQIVSLAMKDHKHDLYEIIGAFAEKRADEVGKMNFMQTVGILRDSIDKEFIDFLKSSGGTTDTHEKE